MKVAILIMATNGEPSISNVAAMKGTFFSLERELHSSNKLVNKYTFFTYWCDPSVSSDVEYEKESENRYNVRVKEDESVYRTFEKTYLTLSTISQVDSFDWFVRINISSYINIPLLDSIIGKMSKHNVYANSLNSYVNADCEFANDLYPRGDTFIFSDETRQDIVKSGKNFLHCDSNLSYRIEVPHVDDCMIGICLITTWGKDYYKRLKLIKYNFFPGEHISDFNRYAISSRVKTLPPGVLYSGYSWDDNKWRRMDGDKMHEINELVKKESYYNLYEELILPKPEESKQAVFITAANRNIYDVFHKALKAKRG